jgi:hypothetical protein
MFYPLKLYNQIDILSIIILNDRLMFLLSGQGFSEIAKLNSSKSLSNKW